MGDGQGRRLEGLRAGEALLESRKIGVPGGVNRFCILLPSPVHLVRVVGIATIGEEIVGRRCGGRCGQGPGPPDEASSNAF